MSVLCNFNAYNFGKEIVQIVNSSYSLNILNIKNQEEYICSKSVSIDYVSTFNKII